MWSGGQRTPKCFWRGGFYHRPRAWQVTRKYVNYIALSAGEGETPLPRPPDMLCHSTGFYLANKEFDTRLIQNNFGNHDIAHTVKYSQTAAKRFEGLWL